LVFSQRSIEKAASIEEVKSKVLGSIIPLFEKGRGNDMAEIKGTYWAAYNAITEYLQYERGETNEGRMDQIWFGSSAQTSKRALDVGLTLAVA